MGRAPFLRPPGYAPVSRWFLAAAVGALSRGLRRSLRIDALPTRPAAPRDARKAGTVPVSA